MYFIFGDSIGLGALNEEGGWAERLRRHVSPQIFYNLSVDGTTLTQLCFRFRNEGVPRGMYDVTRSFIQPDIHIIVAVGINDSATRVNKADVNDSDTCTDIIEFDNNVKWLVSMLRYGSADSTSKVYYLLPTNVDELRTTPFYGDEELIYSNAKIKEFSNIIKKACIDNDVLFITPPHLSTKDLIDGLHPNTKGHAKIFDEIIRTI